MALVGNEILYVQGITPGGSVSSVSEQTTTAAIAALGAAGGTSAAIVDTAITTVGNGTLTAASLVGGQITRTGPVASYTDTTDTAAAILAALPEFVSGATFFIRIKNATAYTQTLAAGSGVTLPLTIINAPFSVWYGFATMGGTSGSPTVTITHMLSAPLADFLNAAATSVTALNTVGAGAITQAMINGGITSRGGSQSNTAFTDTTTTAANIINNNPGLVNKVGTSFLWYYRNTTNATATLTGGSGVTVSGITTVPGGTWALYVVTYTAAATVTIVGIAAANPTTASGTFVANGATAVVVADTNVTANSVINFGLKTVGGTPAGAPFLSAVTAGTGFSVKVAAGDTSTYNYQIVG
jgi:hypothetical protein